LGVVGRGSCVGSGIPVTEAAPEDLPAASVFAILAGFVSDGTRAKATALTPTMIATSNAPVVNEWMLDSTVMTEPTPKVKSSIMNRVKLTATHSD